MNRSPLQWMVAPLAKYAQFGGRAPRAEYWWFVLFQALLLLITFAADIALIGFETVAFYGAGALSGLLILILLLPSLGVTIRRLHDIGRSGWWLLVTLVPLVGPLVVLFWYCQPGTIGNNRFGPDPYGRTDGRPPLPVN